MDDQRRTRWYMGGACTEKTPLPEQLRLAVAPWRQRHGRPPTVVAVHQKEGRAPPPGIVLVEAAGVPAGNRHLYF